MDNTLPNPALSPKPNRRYSRTIALSVTGLVLALGFLSYTGGFNALSKIFGSHAGTDRNLVFAGLENLEGSKDSAPWVKGIESPALMDGAGAFSSFTGVPSYNVEGSTEGVIMPMVTSLNPGEDTFVNHKYTSPALDLGGEAMSFNRVKIYGYFPDGSQVNFNYRTATDIVGLATAPLHPLTGTFAPLPESDTTQVATVNFATAPMQFLQFQVDFQTFVATTRPAVYGFVVEYATTDGGADLTGGDISSRTVSLTYAKTDLTPTVARVQVLSSDASLDPLYTQDGVNLAVIDSFAFSLQLASGAYAIVVTSPTTLTKTVPFEVGADATITINLDAFEASSGVLGAPNPDLNQDGTVNALDATILFNAIGNPTP